MAVLTKYNAFIDEESRGGHNLQTAVFKAALTSSPERGERHDRILPAAGREVRRLPGGRCDADDAERVDLRGGLFTLVLQDYVFTAGPGGIGPFRYIVLYGSSAGNKVIGYYDPAQLASC